MSTSFVGEENGVAPRGGGRRRLGINPLGRISALAEREETDVRAPSVIAATSALSLPSPPCWPGILGVYLKDEARATTM